ncbi:YodC family protein [Sedimentitalea nanhaiensis]|uniref:YodC family protein n=1 Tax=Sedimentitalea nanhaiensis TaxID=999627 RepID=UPI0024804101|nr:DUF2158 domain-containing protein [Sedimentitalea nanhaiensis]
MRKRNYITSAKFSPGDIVQLKSGDPAMTVSKVETAFGSSREGYNCKWFKGDSKERTHFEEETLKAYVAPQSHD